MDCTVGVADSGRFRRGDTFKIGGSTGGRYDGLYRVTKVRYGLLRIRPYWDWQWGLVTIAGWIAAGTLLYWLERVF